jgi:hypothetical protein
MMTATGLSQIPIEILGDIAMFNDRLRHLCWLQVRCADALSGRHAVRLCPLWHAFTSSCMYKSVIALHPRSRSGICEWTKGKYLTRTMGSAGAIRKSHLVAQRRT